MHIRELTIKNYRTFSEPPPFRFADRFTIIAGVNGKGKTAILDGLALLLSRLVWSVFSVRGLFQSIRPSDVHVGASGTELTTKVRFADIPIEYRFSCDSEARKISKTRLPSQLVAKVRSAYGDPLHPHDSGPVVAYYSVDRASYHRPHEPLTERPRGLAGAYTGALSKRRVNFDDFVARYRTFIVLENQARQENPNFLGNHTVKAIGESIATFLDGFRNLRVVENPLRLLVDKDGIAMDLTQVSHGERAFIAVVCDLCQRLALANPLLKNPLDGAGVVLIDELELHLHPTWQVEIVEKLRKLFPNIQFIVTTHSPFILQTAHEGEVIKLGGELAVEPAGRTLEEVARLVMDVTNTERSPHYQAMLDTARKYLDLVEEARTAGPDRRGDIQRELINRLAPFTDNPAYTALLERKGLIKRES